MILFARIIVNRFYNCFLGFNQFLEKIFICIIHICFKLIVFKGVFSFVFGISLANMASHHGTTRNVLMIINILSFLVLLVTILMLGRLPKAQEDLSFKVWKHSCYNVWTPDVYQNNSKKNDVKTLNIIQNTFFLSHLQNIFSNTLYTFLEKSVQTL